MTDSTCNAATCDRPAKNAGLCWAHYQRRRHGRLADGVPVKTWRKPDGDIDQHGYIRLHRPDHPVANAAGRVRLHRMILWDKVGPGWHPCFECGRMVSWDAVFPHPDALTVDHIDGDTSNNDPSNLRPACNVCNPRVGMLRVRAAQRAARGEAA